VDTAQTPGHERPGDGWRSRLKPADPFLRRLSIAAALTAAELALAPVVSDFGLRPADGVRSLVWLALALFGLSYLAVVAVSLALVLLRPNRE
jgi:hypothetical protein